MKELLLLRKSASDFREIFTIRIQNLRKDKRIERHQMLEAAVENFREYIKAEVLADSLILASEVEGEQVELSDELLINIDVQLSEKGVLPKKNDLGFSKS